MSDPVAAKNARRPLAVHRVAEIRFQRKDSPATRLICTCGWAKEWELFVDDEIEKSWSEHKRLSGERAS